MVGDGLTIGKVLNWSVAEGVIEKLADSLKELLETFQGELERGEVEFQGEEEGFLPKEA